MTAQQLVNFEETNAGLEITIVGDEPCPVCLGFGGEHSQYCARQGTVEEQKAHGYTPICEERQVIMDLVEVAEEHNWHADRLLAEILEYNFCNSEWELVPERDYLALGCLTSAPVLSREISRDDSGDEITHAGKVYWFARYERFDPVDQLLKYGKVVFDKGWQEE